MAQTVEADGWCRFKFGGFTVTQISGGLMTVGPGQLWTNVSEENVKTALAAFGLADDVIPLALNTLVLERENKRILIDPGMGFSKLFGDDTAGVFNRNFVSAGFDAAQIDLVLLTHTHPDHACGLLDDGGGALFPNATLVLGAEDYAFWTDTAKLAEDNPYNAWVAVMRDAVAPYQERLTLIKDGDEVVAGIRAIAAPGHTVGQLNYVIDSNKDALIVIGDVAHHADLETRHTGWAFAFDTDSQAACATRERIFEYALKRDYLLHGFHFAWPGIGSLRRTEQGFVFLPVDLRSINERAGSRAVPADDRRP